MSKPIVRVSENDPQRCQGSTGRGPCGYKQAPGSQFCPLHGGSSSGVSQDRAALRNYKLAGAYGDRANGVAATGNVKNLADEIALMRVTLETIFNSIKSPNDMLLYADKIAKLTDGINKLVTGWQKLEVANKELLGRETVLNIFDQLMEKIVELVTDPDVILQLADSGHEIIARGLGE